MKKSAKFEIYEYPSIRYSQRNARGVPDFLLFHAPASEIIKWADVDRLEPGNPRGAQRALRSLKVKKISQFLQKDEKNTIPTAVVVALDTSHISFNEGDGGVGTLIIKAGKELKPGLIIDGQHRVFGVANYSGDVHLNIIAFSGGDDAERAFQFVVINNTATKVSKDHIKALNLQFDEDVLNERLLTGAGVTLGLQDGKFDDLRIIDSSEPFKGLLSFPTNKNGFIPPNAIEGALAETRDRSALLGIEDLERDFFLSIWSRIKETRKDNWKHGSAKNPNHLLQKASIQALTVYVLDNLEAYQRMAEGPVDFTCEETLFSHVDRIIGRIPGEFWETEWTVAGLDTSAGRQKLLESLKIIDSNVRNNRTWYDKVSLIDPALLAGQIYGDVKKTVVSRSRKKRS